MGKNNKHTKSVKTDTTLSSDILSVFGKKPAASNAVEEKREMEEEEKEQKSTVMTAVDSDSKFKVGNWEAGGDGGGASLFGDDGSDDDNSNNKEHEEEEESDSKPVSLQEGNESVVTEDKHVVNPDNEMMQIATMSGLMKEMREKGEEEKKSKKNNKKNKREPIQKYTDEQFEERRMQEKDVRGYVGMNFERMDENRLVKFEEDKVKRLGIKPKEAIQMEDAFVTRSVTDIFSDMTLDSMKGKLSDRLIKGLHDHLSLEKLTLIQSKVLEPALNGKDVLVSSETGSGKTLSYVIPIFEVLYRRSLQERISRDTGALALILAPTRELCQQIHDVVKKITAAFPFIVPGLLIGGEKTKTEKNRLRKGVHIIVATPGRLLYHLQNTESFNVSALKFIVLDEADGLLDLGEEEVVKKIFITIGPKLTSGTKPQSLLVSATLNTSIRKLADYTLKDEVTVGIDDSEKERMEQEDTDVFKVPAGLTQSYIIAPKYLYFSLLVGFLRSRTHEDNLKHASKATASKILVFFSGADPIEFYHTVFMRTKIFPEKNFTVPIFKLHGDMSSEDRTKAYTTFRDQESGILLTTDVAARGLDFPGVDWIVQYDPPGEPKEYLHRIGRTGRLGASGNALILLSENEVLYLKLLEKMNLKINRMNGKTLFEHLALAFGDKFINSNPNSASDHLMNVLSASVAKNEELYQWAVASFLSYTRSYTSYYKDTRYIFHAKNLRLDHMKRMYGLSQKATFLMKQKPRVGKIMEKLNAKKNVKSDLRQEVPHKTDMNGSSSKDSNTDKDGEDVPNDNARSKGKNQREKVDIMSYIDKKRARMEQTKRKLPPIRLPEEIKDSDSYRNITKHRESMKYTVPDKMFGDQHLFGRLVSKSYKDKVFGKTIEGTARDAKKKRRFDARLEDAFLKKGRTSVAEKMVSRNPFDARGQNDQLFQLMHGLTSEFDASMEEPKPKKQKTKK